MTNYYEKKTEATQPVCTTVVHLFEEKDGKLVLRSRIDRAIRMYGLSKAAERTGLGVQTLENALRYFNLLPDGYHHDRMLKMFRNYLDRNEKPDCKKIARRLGLKEYEVHNCLRIEAERLSRLAKAPKIETTQDDFIDELMGSKVAKIGEAEAGVVKAMLARGDKQHDIASWFGVNGGRIAEIAKGHKFKTVPPCKYDKLPPQGPYNRN